MSPSAWPPSGTSSASRTRPTRRWREVCSTHWIAVWLSSSLWADQPHSYVQLRYIYSAWFQSDLCWVEDVYVGDKYRGLGVGRTLMRAAQSRASELGCVRLQLDANEAQRDCTGPVRIGGLQRSQRFVG